MNNTYHSLSQKWGKRHKDVQERFWSKHKNTVDWLKENSKQFAVGSLGSLLLLTHPGSNYLPKPHTLLASENAGKDIGKSVFLISDLANVLPPIVRPLTKEEEEKVIDILVRDTGIKLSAEIEGKRLERNYGLIGKEQHLARYPGDSIFSHFDNEDDRVHFVSAGMAPGLGAWGYFVPSAELLTKEDIEREKYYIAVQTFLAKDFQEKFAEYRDFFKYRKMILVNPQNGKAIVTDIADSGPAVWTGKHLGGSPEVMDYLEREDGAARGPVLYFFIDDSDSVPLGPVTPLQ